MLFQLNPPMVIPPRASPRTDALPSRPSSLRISRSRLREKAPCTVACQTPRQRPGRAILAFLPIASRLSGHLTRSTRPSTSPARTSGVPVNFNDQVNPSTFLDLQHPRELGNLNPSTPHHPLRSLGREREGAPALPFLVIPPVVRPPSPSSTWEW